MEPVIVYLLLANVLLCIWVVYDTVMSPRNVEYRRLRKVWEDKGLDTSNVIGFDETRDHIAYTRNSVRVMLTRDELLEQELKAMEEDKIEWERICKRIN